MVYNLSRLADVDGYCRVCYNNTGKFFSRGDAKMKFKLNAALSDGSDGQAGSYHGKQKIYFTGHPDDFLTYFDDICKMIWENYPDCAVFYDEDPDHPEDTDNFESDLDRMRLIIIAVTRKFIDCKTAAFDRVFKHAVKNHIPVLPILEEENIEDAFNSKCGDIQALDPNSTDPTAISFEEKFRLHLDRVLIGNELAKRICNDFAAHIFLSYRKKDRGYAQQLMRLIHSNDSCRDIAIWYDEFLVPGENFNNAIKEAMERSNVFTVAVTPNLLEKGNYVVNTEYPIALDMDKKILPAELVPTDKKELTDTLRTAMENKEGEWKESYADDRLIPELVSADGKALEKSLTDALGSVTHPDADKPEHLYNMGLAYLSGINAEVDHDRAVKLITRAADMGLPDAVEKLRDMYENGDGVERDRKRSRELTKRLIEVCKEEYTKKPGEIISLKWVTAWQNYIETLAEEGNADKQEQAYLEMLGVCETVNADLGTNEIKYLLGWGYQQMGHMYINLWHDREKAKIYFDKGLKLSLACRDGSDLWEYSVAESYSSIACLTAKNKSTALKYAQTALEIYEGLDKRSPSVLNRKKIMTAISALGITYENMKDTAGAKDFYKKAYDLSRSIAEQTDDPNNWGMMIPICERLRDIYYPEDIPKAIEYGEETVRAAENHARTDTFKSKVRLAAAYHKLGDIYINLYLREYDKENVYTAKEWYEKGTAISEELTKGNGIGYSVWDCKIYNSYRLAKAHYYLGEYSKAQEYCIESLKACHLVKEMQHLSRQEYRAHRPGVTDSPQEIYLNDAAQNNLLMTSENYRLKGDILAHREKYGQAKEQYEEWKKKYEELADEYDDARCRVSLPEVYNTLGYIKRKTKECSAAKKYYEKSIEKCRELFPKNSKSFGLSVAYSGLGDICMDRKQLSDARKYYEECLKIRKGIGLSDHTFEEYKLYADTYINYGNLLMSLGETETGTEYLEKGREITDRIGHCLSEPELKDIRQRLEQHS